MVVDFGVGHWWPIFSFFWTVRGYQIGIIKVVSIAIIENVPLFAAADSHQYDLDLADAHSKGDSRWQRFETTMLLQNVAQAASMKVTTIE